MSNKTEKNPKGAGPKKKEKTRPLFMRVKEAHYEPVKKAAIDKRNELEGK